MMRAFVVYRRENGEVLHLHFQPCELDIDVDEIVAMVGSTRDAPLEVLECPADKLPNRAFAVREGRLVEVTDGAMAAAGETIHLKHGNRSYEDLRRTTTAAQKPQAP